MNPEISSRTGNVIRAAKVASLIGLVSVAGACGTGRGNAIKDCNGYSSDIAVTWKGQPGYKRDTDPDVLIQYVKDPRYPSGLGILDHTSPDLHKDDKIDKPGEMVCIFQGDPVDALAPKPGTEVLTFDGARVQDACDNEGFPEYTGHPVKQPCR